MILTKDSTIKTSTVGAASLEGDHLKQQGTSDQHPDGRSQPILRIRGEMKRIKNELFNDEKSPLTDYIMRRIERWD